jgi:hypothetical protein
MRLVSRQTSKLPHFENVPMTTNQKEDEKHKIHEEACRRFLKNYQINLV